MGSKVDIKSDVFEFTQPSKKRPVRGYNSEEEGDDSSDEDDMMPVVRYAKKARERDLTKDGLYKEDPVQLVNQFVRDICPFQANDCWQNDPVEQADLLRPIRWQCTFQLTEFKCLKRLGQGVKQLMDVEQDTVTEVADTKQDAKRAAAEVVLAGWLELGLTSREGFPLVDRAPILQNEKVLPAVVRSDDLAKMRSQGRCPPLRLDQYVQPEHVRFVNDQAGANEVVRQLGELRQFVWDQNRRNPDPERKTFFVAIDLEWRPYMPQRDEEGGSGGPASMLQLCYRDPTVERGPLHVVLFHLPRIGGLYAPGAAHPVPGGMEGNRAFNEACRKACETALASLVPGFLQDEDIIKVGVNVYSDARKLQENLPANTLAVTPKNTAVPGDQDKFVGFLDLQTWARQQGYKVTGLENLLAILCHLRINKVLTAAEWDWERATLLKRQKEYAACDVLATYMVYEKLRDARGYGCV